MADNPAASTSRTTASFEAKSASQESPYDHSAVALGTLANRPAASISRAVASASAYARLSLDRPFQRRRTLGGDSES